MPSALRASKVPFELHVYEHGRHGVGLAKAEAIVAHREQNGPFASADQLAEVKGIGLRTVDKNRERIEVGAPQQ